MKIPKTANFASVIIGFSLAGCSVQDTLSLGVEDPCASLKNIVADYPAGFEQYRGSANDFRSVTVYKAKEQLIRGHCEIWSWANNDSAYVCSGNTPNDKVATTRYNTAVNWMGQCLGDSWTSQENPRTRDGENAGIDQIQYFRKGNTECVGSQGGFPRGFRSLCLRRNTQSFSRVLANGNKTRT